MGMISSLEAASDDIGCLQSTDDDDDDHSGDFGRQVNNRMTVVATGGHIFKSSS
jgi:hypothetical protein